MAVSLRLTVRGFHHVRRLRLRVIRGVASEDLSSGPESRRLSAMCCGKAASLCALHFSTFGIHERIMNQIRKILVSLLLFSTLVLLLSFSVQAQPRRAMAPADILRIANVSDPQISP